MPELPEVETVVRDLLAAGVVGATIDEVRVSWPRTVAGMSARRLGLLVIGCRIVDVRRRGKYIMIALSSREWLLIHLRMTGRLHLERSDVPVALHERAALRFKDGRELRFIDTRKFGRWVLVDDIAPVLGSLGPEPLAPDFRARELCAILEGHKRMLKPMLLDQEVIAGIGNIYVDEALWDARLHPCRLSNTLSWNEVKRLHGSIRKVLRRGLRSMGTSLGTGTGNFYSVAGRRGRNQDGLRVFRRQGEPCVRCKSSIERLTVGQRGTHICPSCQKL
jgi:formamidopyrimidine-DNA glycosylase